MARYGLIGFPLINRQSADYFQRKFASHEGANTYSNYPLESLKYLPELVIAEQLSGFSVTIPYKEEILNHLSQIDSEAGNVGAVNTVKITSHGWIGYNTDVVGFKNSLLPLLLPHHQKALILGTGGAAKAVAYVLKSLEIPYQMISRDENKGLNYLSLTADLIREHLLLINASPVGMGHLKDQAPQIPYEGITQQHLVYDLIYLPEKTIFLSMAEARGASIKNGMEMLHLQADKAFDIWIK
ncbi:MAG: shikimate dehydrogenase [Bacteroidia bacterium]|jgi:shikimate dehydrogenase